MAGSPFCAPSRPFSRISAAENHDYREADPEHGFDLAAANEKQDHLTEGAENRHDRREEDGCRHRGEAAVHKAATEFDGGVGIVFGRLEADEKADDGKEVKEEFHAWVAQGFAVKEDLHKNQS